MYQLPTSLARAQEAQFVLTAQLCFGFRFLETGQLWLQAQVQVRLVAQPAPLLAAYFMSPWEQ